MPARVVSIAPSPFSHWYRVAFDGLGLEWWRWIPWEGPGPFRNDEQSSGDAQVEPFAPYVVGGRYPTFPSMVLTVYRAHTRLCLFVRRLDMCFPSTVALLACVLLVCGGSCGP